MVNEQTQKSQADDTAAEVGRQDLLSTGEASEYLRIGKTTLVDWVNGGKIVPAMTTLGGHHRFTREELDRVKSLMSVAAV